MSEITYNLRIEFKNKKDKTFWLNLLNEEKDMFNFASNLIFNKKPKLNQKIIHDLIYTPIRNKSIYLNSQCVCKVERDVLGTFRSIKSNQHVIEEAPEKKNLSMRLDKRLYSNFNKNEIYLVSEDKGHRCKASLCLYPQIEELFNKYSTRDPLIYCKNGIFYLSVPFNIPDPSKQNDDSIGLDLGCRRLVTTSNGEAIKSTDYLKQKRKIRYLKRIYNSKKKKSHSARTKLKKLRHKEHNFSKKYIEKSVNFILKNTKESNIVIEDLKNIKKRTNKKNSSHNKRISQIPFYMFKMILTYKATLCGKVVQTVNPSYTSQIDCTTNQTDGKRRGCRYYSKNGYVLDADWNAAINIKNRFTHLVSYIKLPLDGCLIILNKQVAVNQPIVNKITSNSQAHPPLGGE